MNTTTYNCSIRRTFATYATGIDTRTTARTRSARIRTGRRGSRSTHAPAISPTRRTERLPATTRNAISVGPAPSTSNANSGIAVRVTTDPSSETVWPAHSFMNSGWRQSEGVTIEIEDTGAPPAITI